MFMRLRYASGNVRKYMYSINLMTKKWTQESSLKDLLCKALREVAKMNSEC